MPEPERRSRGRPKKTEEIDWERGHKMMREWQKANPTRGRGFTQAEGECALLIIFGKELDSPAAYREKVQEVAAALGRDYQTVLLMLCDFIHTGLINPKARSQRYSKSEHQEEAEEEESDEEMDHMFDEDFGVQDEMNAAHQLMDLVDGTAAKHGDEVLQNMSPELKELYDALKNKRHRYDDDEKTIMVWIWLECGRDFDKALDIIQSIKKFGNVRKDCLERWAAEFGTETAERGPKPHWKFEKLLLNKLYLSGEVINSSTGEKTIVVLGSIFYNYAIIKQEAEDLREELLKDPEWSNDEKLRELAFSNKWVFLFNSRHGINGRKVTAIAKARPTPQDLKTIMTDDIQKTIIDGDFLTSETFNGDETAVNQGANPRIQYILNGMKRASAPSSQEKKRFTAFLCSDADGKMAPAFFIIKCSSKKPDLSGIRVLGELHKKEGFTKEDGRVHHDGKKDPMTKKTNPKPWTRSLELKMRESKKLETHQYIRPYLKHEKEGHIITAQHKAWMDSVTVCMLCDLLLHPLKEKLTRKKMLMVWDNCGPHKVEAVKKVFEECGIVIKTFPPNMTDLLQPMDLAVNKPVKNGIIRDRVNEIGKQFKQWREEAEATLKAGQELKPFQPSNPQISFAITSVLRMLAADFTKPKFMEGVAASYVTAGLRKDEDTEMYRDFEHFIAQDAVDEKSAQHLTPIKFEGQDVPNMSQTLLDMLIWMWKHDQK